VSDQVYPTFNALEAHTAIWADSAEYPVALRKDVLNTFRARREKHYHPAQTASLVLDPVNFEMQGEFGHAGSLVQLGTAKLTQCFFLTWNMSPR